MSADWKITIANEYWDVLIARLKELARAGKARLSEEDQSAICAEYEDIERLDTQSAALVSGQVNPLDVLEEGKDEKGNVVYFLKVGRWAGVYYLDVTKKEGWGVTCRRSG